jgi:hypothetical protein
MPGYTGSSKKARWQFNTERGGGKRIEPPALDATLAEVITHFENEVRKIHRDTTPPRASALLSHMRGDPTICSCGWRFIGRFEDHLQAELDDVPEMAQTWIDLAAEE